MEKLQNSIINPFAPELGSYALAYEEMVTPDNAELAEIPEGLDEYAGGVALANVA